MQCKFLVFSRKDFFGISRTSKAQQTLRSELKLTAHFLVLSNVLASGSQDFRCDVSFAGVQLDLAEFFGNMGDGGTNIYEDKAAE